MPPVLWSSITKQYISRDHHVLYRKSGREETTTKNHTVAPSYKNLHTFFQCLSPKLLHTRICAVFSVFFFSKYINLYWFSYTYCIFASVTSMKNIVERLLTCSIISKEQYLEYLDDSWNLKNIEHMKKKNEYLLTSLWSTKTWYSVLFTLHTYRMSEETFGSITKWFVSVSRQYNTEDRKTYSTPHQLLEYSSVLPWSTDLSILALLSSFLCSRQPSLILHLKVFWRDKNA